MTFSRREFLRKCADSMAYIAAAAAFPKILALPHSAESRVVEVRDKRLKRTEDNMNPEITLKLLNQALRKLTGAKSDISAWKNLFNRRERIGIKISCLPGRKLSTSVGLVHAISEGLGLAGIPAENIIVWERTARELKEAGFTLSRHGVRVVGTDQYKNGGYENRIVISGSVGTCFSVLMEKFDAIISVPVLKDHDIAGISAGMKNFYGAIYNPNKFHGNGCNPYVADLCASPEIRDKLRLVIVDASRIQLQNGPAYFHRYALEYGGLLVGTDPVAVDAEGWRIIDRQRVKKGLKTLKQVNRQPGYIAAAEKRGLGHMEGKYIDRIIL
ncbi:MAG: DUF362 domain-containing protein [Acidobacteria bacterium]|nr:DUF362 domain-containing protein [Acidobacteriota bacterium]